MRKFAIIAACAVLATACFANEQKPDAKKGEGDWGMNGAAVVRVYNVDTHGRGHRHERERGMVRGEIRNVSDHPIQRVAISIGRHHSDGDENFGSDSFPGTLQPNSTWNWSVDTDTTKRQGYEVLDVTVDGQSLTDLNPEPAH